MTISAVSQRWAAVMLRGCVMELEFYQVSHGGFGSLPRKQTPSHGVGCCLPSGTTRNEAARVPRARSSVGCRCRAPRHRPRSSPDRARPARSTSPSGRPFLAYSSSSVSFVSSRWLFSLAVRCRKPVPRIKTDRVCRRHTHIHIILRSHFPERVGARGSSCGRVSQPIVQRRIFPRSCYQSKALQPP